MKHLFFVAVATGIFSGTSISVKAQTNVNIERFADRAHSNKSPKFIEGIEVVPGVSSNSITVIADEVTTVTPAIIKPSDKSFQQNIEVCSALQFKYAMMMDCEVESITNYSLYNFIEDWWATRYRYGGSDRSGIDCSAFTGRLLADVFGVNAPRTAKEQFDNCEKVATEDLLEGDLVFFNTRGGISHVGLYLGNNYFVHSSVHSGVTISSLTEDYYSRKFISGGRLKRP